jgi:hypothetical protein
MNSKFGVVKPSDLPVSEQRRPNPRDRKPRKLAVEHDGSYSKGSNGTFKLAPLFSSIKPATGQKEKHG